MPATDLSSLIAEGRFPLSNPAFGFKRKGKWETISFQQYFDDATALSSVLASLGVTKGSKVASITLNRPEWNVLDLALLRLGAVHVSIFPNFNLDDFSFSIAHTDCELVFVTGDTLRNQLKQHGIAQRIFTFDANRTDADSLPELLATGRSMPEPVPTTTVEAKDVAAIYLTSGTGGRSKGVVMTHGAIVNTVLAMRELYDIGSDDRALSFAPLCVSSERSLNYYYQTNGICTYYTESMMKVVENMQEVKPTIFLGAPVLLEKIREKIFEKSGTIAGMGGIIFKWALGLTDRFSLDGLSLPYRLQHALADRLVYAKLREVMGGRVRFIMAGGAAIPVEICRFFHAIDIPVFEGYGLSECHIISVNRNGAGVRFGTVGPLFGQTEVKLDATGEILCRSPYLFSGYYANEELTRASFDSEGFFHTGDKGEWVEGHYLRIIGRVKDLFKISTGRYISPDHVEKLLNGSSSVQQSIIIGANRTHISALVVPAFEYLRSSVKELAALSDAQLCAHPTVRAIIAKELEAVNAAFIESERIKRFHLLEAPFSIEKGELTPSSKLKRHTIEQAYHLQIDALYDH